MGALHTFAKQCKQVPASRSNIDTSRALVEVNNLALSKYSLKHVKGYQDRIARAEDLSLEARLNVEYNEMAKDAARGPLRRKLRHKTQELPLEKAPVFFEGKEQTSDLKEDPKKQIGAVQVNAYYTIREKRKGGMDAETVETNTLEHAEAALERTSKMFKMWYAKQGSGFCGVG